MILFCGILCETECIIRKLEELFVKTFITIKFQLKIKKFHEFLNKFLNSEKYSISLNKI